MTYEYMPPAKNQWIKTLCMGVFFGALVLFMVSGVKDLLPIPWLFQFAAVAMMTASIMLMGRYLLRYYMYRIEEVSGGVDFTVTEITRRGGTTVCRLGLSQLRAVKEWNDQNKPPRGKKLYNYCADARPEASLVLEFSDGGEIIYIRCSPDERMTELFRRALSDGEGAAQ